MIKSILVALDGLKASDSALNVAAEIARISKAKLKGLYVEDIIRLLEWQPVELLGATVGTATGIPKSRPTEEQVEIEKEFVEETNKIKSRFKSVCDGAELEGYFFTLRGKVDEMVIEAAKSADLIVIGKRGRTYPEGAPEPGPTTENLLRATVRPVIVVPPEGKRTTRILIAYDGSQSAQRALSFGALFATLQSSEIEVLSVTEKMHKAEKLLNEATDFLSPYQVKASYIKADGKEKPWKLIIENAKNFNAGLIVLGAYGKIKFKELIFGSTTKNVLARTECPVLLCK